MNAMSPIRIAGGGNVLVLPWDASLATVVPGARDFTHEGERLLAVPNHEDVAKLARNLGMPVPPPILTRYDWTGHQPWDVQKRTAALMVEEPRCFVLNELGTGKTRAALYAFDWLRQRGKAKRMLVSGPLSTLVSVWENEIFRNFPNLRYVTLHGTREKRRKRLAESADIYIINHHGLPIMQAELIARGFDVFLVDELAIFRNSRTHMWKSAFALSKAVNWVWGMTGSPMPMEPPDAWAQARLVTPTRPLGTFTAFRDATMTKVSPFRWAAKPGAIQTAFRTLQPSVRFTRNDVMELPPTTYQVRTIELDPVAKQAYDTLRRRMQMANDQGLITAANEGVLHSKLLQVSLGWVYGDSGTIFQLPAHSRLNTVEEYVAASANKVIVFVPYIHALHGVAEHLRKAGHNIAVVHGGTPKGQRDKLFSVFQHGAPGEGPRVIVAHPKCMAHGLTLTEADTIVWTSPTSDLETYEQANARITRPGQRNKTLIVNLIGTPVEKITLRRLMTRSNSQGVLLELLAQQEQQF